MYFSACFHLLPSFHLPISGWKADINTQSHKFLAFTPSAAYECWKVFCEEAKTLSFNHHWRLAFGWDVMSSSSGNCWLGKFCSLTFIWVWKFDAFRRMISLWWWPEGSLYRDLRKLWHSMTTISSFLDFSYTLVWVNCCSISSQQLVQLKSIFGTRLLLVHVKSTVHLHQAS